MKSFVAMILLLAVAIVFLAAQSFQYQFGGTTYSPPVPAQEQPPGTGGSPRRADLPAQPPATSSSSNSFQGPTGRPYIVGPKTPPPGE